MSKRIKTQIHLNTIALTMMLIGEICFFQVEMKYVYLFWTGSGIVIGLLSNIKRLTYKIKLDNFILWAIIVHTMFLFYGIFLLQKGRFPIETTPYRLVESIALYLVLSTLLSKKITSAIHSFMIAGSISVVYLIIKEKENILKGVIRIGDSLSGNVNTVGFCFGIVSMVVMWSYCLEKKTYKLLFFILLSAMMLLTGSKKTLIILIFDILMWAIYERKKLGTWLKIALIGTLASYVVFNIPYFYDIIGQRIESMINLFSADKTADYSTQIRSLMIQEGFHFFKTKPIFGGGWNYFFSRTIYEFDYSHCNYIEMLCSFGVIGTVLFYYRHLGNLRVLVRNRRYLEGDNHHLMMIAISFILTALIFDWGAVTFSAQAIFYLPLIFSSSAIYAIRYNVSQQT